MVDEVEGFYERRTGFAVNEIETASNRAELGGMLAVGLAEIRGLSLAGRHFVHQ
jgi:hypothetical protein